MTPVLRALSVSTLALSTISLLAQSPAFKGEFYPFQSAGSAVQVDLNGDGIPDFITRFNSQELLSNGSGGFTTQTYKLPAGANYGVPVAGGDFNKDGKADVVFAKPLGIAYGDGKGGFTSYQAIPWSNNDNYDEAVVADFNGDGLADFAIAYAATFNATYQVALFINNGHGFNSAVTIYTQGTIPGGGYQYTTALDLVLGDFDSDGHADVVLRTTETDPNPNNYGGSLLTLTALYGNGGGHFTAKTVKTSVNTERFQVASADMNNDGVSDLVAMDPFAPSTPISIFYGQRNRTFTRTNLAATNIGSDGAPMLADFDGDGRKDIVYPARDINDNVGVSALLQTASGVFAQQAFYQIDTFRGAAGEVPFQQTFVGDYNRDGRPDGALMTSNNEYAYPLSAAVLLNPAGVPDGACKAPAPIGIAVCSPNSNQTVSNPVSFSFAANSFYPVRKMEIWIDDVKRSETYKVFANEGFADVKLSLAAGKHDVDLYAVGFDQTYLMSTYTITVK